jgi:DNA-directed RNA polymerase specialized sigma24 family protein
MAREPDTYTQKFLADNYNLIVNVSKTLSKQYEDLAHDVCIELTRCVECLKQVINPRPYIFVFARRIEGRKRQRWDNRRGNEQENHESITTESINPHNIQQEYYNNPDLTADEKFLLDLYLDNNAEIGKVAKAIHISPRHTSLKIKAICTKLRLSE